MSKRSMAVVDEPDAVNLADEVMDAAVDEPVGEPDVDVGGEPDSGTEAIDWQNLSPRDEALLQSALAHAQSEYAPHLQRLAHLEAAIQAQGQQPAQQAPADPDSYLESITEEVADYMAREMRRNPGADQSKVALKGLLNAVLRATHETIVPNAMSGAHAAVQSERDKERFFAQNPELVPMREQITNLVEQYKVPPALARDMLAPYVQYGMHRDKQLRAVTQQRRNQGFTENPWDRDVAPQQAKQENLWAKSAAKRLWS